MAPTSSLLQGLAGRVRFGLIDLARGTHALKLLDELDAMQFDAPDALRARQQALLDDYAALVRAASPLYRPYSGFAQFPVIDKAFANASRESLFNPRYRGKVVRKKTGGSTGEPFVYATGVRSQSYLWASILLSWKVAGYQLGEPVAFVAGTALFGTRYKQKIYYKLMNVHMFSAFDMSAARMQDYCAGIARSGCRLLYGYASAIHQLARHLLGGGARPRFALRGIVCTAEVLTDAMRADIEQAFGVPCFSQYGCNDAGVSAYECERRQGFHLITQRCYQEVLEGGQLVSTDLSNDAFFLPRYDTGDLVQMADAPCPCGRGFPLIAKVVGRANDMVADSAGNAVHSEFFTHLFREDRRIKAFQVLYDASDLVVIVHCDDPGFSHPAYLERIGAALKFGSISFAVNQPFVTIKNGKHRFVMKVERLASALSQSVA